MDFLKEAYERGMAHALDSAGLVGAEKMAVLNKLKQWGGNLLGRGGKAAPTPGAVPKAAPAAAAGPDPDLQWLQQRYGNVPLAGKRNAQIIPPKPGSNPNFPT